MLAKHLGASVFVAVGSNAKKDQVMKAYDIPEDHVFSSRHLSFAAGIKRLTNGRGADVVVISIAGEAIHETFECLAKLGRLVEIGRREVLANGRLDMATFNKSVTFASVDLTIVLEQYPILAKRMITEAFALLASGMIHLVQPLNIFSLSDMESAFRLIQAGKYSGKVVLQADESRMKSTHTASIESELESKGNKLAVYKCDIANREQLGVVLRNASEEMPPVKGVIQSAMVIRDTIIDRMFLEDYQDALRPKVQGTLNIHDALINTPLDFFIILFSCVAIIGNNGQANYSSACTFQDAYARYWTNLGMPTRSIDLGMIEDAGYVSENVDVYKFLTAQGFQPVRMNELLAVIDYAISQPIRNLDDCHLIIGLDSSNRTPLSY
ncbi:MAG: hypothetical protein Q9188_001730 [Gyalolechia gomerana]